MSCAAVSKKRESHVSRTSSLIPWTAPKLLERGGAGLVRPHARRDVLLNEHVDVVLQLDVELGLVAFAPEQRRESRAQMAAGHDALLE